MLEMLGMEYNKDRNKVDNIAKNRVGDWMIAQKKKRGRRTKDQNVDGVGGQYNLLIL